MLFVKYVIVFLVCYFLIKYQNRYNEFYAYEKKHGHPYIIEVKDKFSIYYSSCTPFTIDFIVSFQNVSDEIMLEHLEDIYGTNNVRIILFKNTKFVIVYK